MWAVRAGQSGSCAATLCCPARRTAHPAIRERHTPRNACIGTACHAGSGPVRRALSGSHPCPTGRVLPRGGRTGPPEWRGAPGRDQDRPRPLASASLVFSAPPAHGDQRSRGSRNGALRMDRYLTRRSGLPGSCGTSCRRGRSLILSWEPKCWWRSEGGVSPRSGRIRRTADRGIGPLRRRRFSHCRVASACRGAGPDSSPTSVIRSDCWRCAATR